MKKYPIHENLNTSFVNLKALVDFLSDLQFVGSIHVELSSYDADIMFTDTRNILAREYDHIAGKSAYGDEALNRILRRAKEPCGRIHVYQGGATVTNRDLSEIFVDESIVSDARSTIGSRSDTRVSSFDSRQMRIIPSDEVFEIEDDVFAFDDTTCLPELPDLPYLLREGSDIKEIERDLPTRKEWSELLDLTAELLRTIEASLKNSQLDFTKAFANASAIVAADHPFLDPVSGGLKYNDGWLTIGDPMDSGEFVAGVTDALARIFSRLREEPHFGKTLHWTTHRIRVLTQIRRGLYERFGIANRLEQIIG